MRTSILSRSAIAVASLAIGSATLAAVPAGAATPTGVTRDMVLAAAASVRADGAIDNPEATSPASQVLLDALVTRVCDVSDGYDGEAYGTAVETPDGADGVAVTALLSLGEGPIDGAAYKTCSFVAVAPIGNATTFSGEATVSTLTLNFQSEGEPFTPSREAYELTGDVFVSPAVQATGGIAFSGVQAQGLLTSPGTTRVLTISKVADKKTKAEKRYAKKKYEKRIKAAKKAYAKALKRAGGDTVKKTAARLTYASRKASVTSRYKYQIASYKLVKTRSTQAQSRRFSVETTGFSIPILAS